jgi:hypothetical protein
VGVPTSEQRYVGSRAGSLQTGSGSQKCLRVTTVWPLEKVLKLGSRFITVLEETAILCEYKTQRVGGGVEYRVENLMQSYAVRWRGGQWSGGGGWKAGRELARKCSSWRGTAGR